MSITGERFTISYDAIDQQINFEGVLRIIDEADLQSIGNYLSEMHERIDGSMRLNFRKMRYINSSSLKVIIDFLKYARESEKLSINRVCCVR
jgi:hypothetical protein